MPESPALRVLNVDRMHDGVFVEFSDGNSAVYPAKFLHSMLHTVGGLPETELDDEDDSSISPQKLTNS